MRFPFPFPESPTAHTSVPRQPHTGRPDVAGRGGPADHVAPPSRVRSTRSRPDDASSGSDQVVPSPHGARAATADAPGASTAVQVRPPSRVWKATAPRDDREPVTQPRESSAQVTPSRASPAPPGRARASITRRQPASVEVDSVPPSPVVSTVTPEGRRPTAVRETTTPPGSSSVVHSPDPALVSSGERSSRSTGPTATERRSASPDTTSPPSVGTPGGVAFSTCPN